MRVLVTFLLLTTNTALYSLPCCQFLAVGESRLFSMRKAVPSNRMVGASPQDSPSHFTNLETIRQRKAASTLKMRRLKETLRKENALKLQRIMRMRSLMNDLKHRRALILRKMKANEEKDRKKFKSLMLRMMDNTDKSMVPEDKLLDIKDQINKELQEEANLVSGFKDTDKSIGKEQAILDEEIKRESDIGEYMPGNEQKFKDETKMISQLHKTKYMAQPNNESMLLSEQNNTSSIGLEANKTLPKDTNLFDLSGKAPNFMQGTHPYARIMMMLDSAEYVHKILEFFADLFIKNFKESNDTDKPEEDLGEYPKTKNDTAEKTEKSPPQAERVFKKDQYIYYE